MYVCSVFVFVCVVFGSSYACKCVVIVGLFAWLTLCGYVCFRRRPGVWFHALSPLVRIQNGNKYIDVIGIDLSYLGLCFLFYGYIGGVYVL